MVNKFSCAFALKILKPIRIFYKNEINIKIAINLNINPCTKQIATHHHLYKKKIEKNK